MKKSLTTAIAFLLVAALLIPASGLAATMETLALKTYEEPNGVYTTVYPERWILMDKDSIDQLVADAKDNKTSDTGMNLEAIEQYAPLIAASPVAMFVDMFLADNFNVTYSQNPSYALYTTESLLSQLGPMLEAQYMQIYQEPEMLNKGELVTYGDNQYLFASVSFQVPGGVRQSDQFYMLHGDKMLVITFTLFQQDGQLSPFNRELMEEVLSQFKPL